MPTRPAPTPPVGERVYLRAPRRRDAADFLAAAQHSRRLHASWVLAPQTEEAFAAYVRRFGARRVVAPAYVGYLALHRDDDSPVGVFNLSEIVRGAFQSAYLGYYGFRPHAGKGLMKEALALALDAAFGTLGLHRVEANVQPTNVRSIALVEAVGFADEGFSRRYLRIAGRWRDHRRYAMLAEDWQALRSRAARRPRVQRSTT
jgi:[ribosomal protein S5]-alanine N-acetyltransferase